MAKTGQFLSVELDISRAQTALSGTSKSLVTISRQTLGIIGRGTVDVVKKEIRATTKRRSGELLRSYRYKVKKDGSEMNVFPKGIKGENIFSKVMALSYGTENGRLRPRGFVQKGNNYIEGSEYEASIDRMIDRELAKYWS
jgi:hypothetical protein